MPLLALANELLDQVFEHCDKESIKSSRLTSQRLRKVANRYLIRELRLCYNQESLDILEALATTHQDIAKGIKALWLQADRLQKFSNYDSWNAKREEQFGESAFPKEDWSKELQAHGVAITRKIPPLEVHGSGKVSRVAKTYLKRCYDHYKKMYAQQCVLDSSNALREKSAAFFRVCPNVTRLWITSGGVARYSSTHRSPSFQRGLVLPVEFRSQSYSNNVRIPSELLLGVFEAGAKIDTLVLGNVDYRFLTQGTSKMSKIGHIIKHLEHFQWDIGEMFVRDHDEMHTTFETGFFASFITNATKLKTLVIKLPDLPHTRLIPVDFAEMFDDDTHFPSLESFSLKGVETGPEDLEGFLLRHTETLEQLRLCDLHLKDNDGQRVDWQGWFSAIGGKLPRLEKVSLRGVFHYGGAITHMFGMGGGEYVGTELSRVMEAFLISGGEEAPFRRSFYYGPTDEMTREKMLEWAGDALVPEIRPEGWDMSWEEEGA